jgi:hypothetical protein
MYSDRSISKLLGIFCIGVLFSGQLTAGMQILPGTVEGPNVMVADAASTILLLGIALVVLEIVRRYFAKPAAILSLKPELVTRLMRWLFRK